MTDLESDFSYFLYEAGLYEKNSQYENALLSGKQALQLPGANESAEMPQLLDCLAMCVEGLRVQGIEPELADIELLAHAAMAFSQPATKEQRIKLMGALGTCARRYYDLELYEKAEELERRGLQYIENMEFDYKATFLVDHAILVASLCYQEKFDEALVAADAWMKMAVEELAENDIYFAQIHQTMANAFWSMKDFDKAVIHYKQALWLHENEGCEYCSDVPSILNPYSKLLFLLGRDEEAEAIKTRAEKIEAGEQG